MIFGIGTDIVSVDRIAAGLNRYGDRFARRILADDEYQAYRHSARQASFLAKRFAAKEAVAKALGTGFRQGLSLRQISVGHNELGRPELRYSGHAAEFCRRHGIASSHISLADERDYAVAFVTLLTS